MAIQIRLSAMLICLTVAGSGGCASHGTSLEALKAQQRHEVYKGCVDTLMKEVSFGSGPQVHQACLAWSQSRL